MVPCKTGLAIRQKNGVNMYAHSTSTTAIQKLGAILTIFICATVVASCAAQADPNSTSDNQTEAAGQNTEATETTTPEQTAEATEEAVQSTGKLLDPCALILPSETGELIGQPILSNYRSSSWKTFDFTYIYSNASIENATIGFYRCDMLDYNSNGTKTNVFVNKDAETAQAMLREHNLAWTDWLDDYGLETVEVSGLGDLAFRPTTPPTETVVPDLAFAFGNYVVEINLNPPGGYPLNRILDFGNLILSRLPADVHSVLPDENLTLETNQPSGKLIEPCALVTLEEARTMTVGLFDGPIIEERSDSTWGIGDIDTYYCTFFASSNTSTRGIPGLEIWTWNYKDLNYYYSLLEGTTLNEVEGLGDRAFTNSPIYDDAELTVVSGKFVIDIDFHDIFANPEAQFDAAVEMAKIILSRLPATK
jgi:hypothetical protein